MARPGEWIATAVLGTLLAVSAARAQKPAVAPTPAPAADADLERAANLLRENKVEEALAAIRAGAAKHPEWPPVRLILARLHFSLNQAVPGRLALEAADVEGPDNSDVILTFASQALNEGRYHDAKLNCEKALTLAEKMRPDSEAARNTRRDAHAGLAAVAENRRQWEQARDHLQEWLKQDDKSVPANQRLGRALYMAGHKDEALHALTRAHELDPNADAPLVSMAQLAAQNGDAVAAGDFLERAVKADPKSVKVRVAQARWLIDAEKVDAAKAVIAEAKKIDPASKDVERLNGLIAWNQRDFASAEKIFEALHKEVPSDLGVSNLLALSLAEQEDSAKRARALQIAEANVRLSQTAEIVATLARTQYRAGKLDDAERTMQVLSTNSSGQIAADAAFFGARMMADRGRVEDARNLLRQIVSLQGLFAYRREALDLLQKLEGPGETKPQPATKTAPKDKAAKKL